jgi:hypothetical protein
MLKEWRQSRARRPRAPRRPLDGISCRGLAVRGGSALSATMLTSREAAPQSLEGSLRARRRRRSVVTTRRGAGTLLHEVNTRELPWGRLVYATTTASDTAERAGFTTRKNTGGSKKAAQYPR